jgi:hypothetical protein
MLTTLPDALHAVRFRQRGHEHHEYSSRELKSHFFALEYLQGLDELHESVVLSIRHATSTL